MAHYAHCVACVLRLNPKPDPLMQLKDLRALLRGAGRNEEGAVLFTTLYRSWCHSLGAVLSLCFLIEVPPPAQPCTAQAQHARAPCAEAAQYSQLSAQAHLALYSNLLGVTKAHRQVLRTREQWRCHRRHFQMSLCGRSNPLVSVHGSCRSGSH